MEVGAHVWLRRGQSHWGWVPAVVSGKREITNGDGVKRIDLTLNDDPNIEMTMQEESGPTAGRFARAQMAYFADQEPFETVVTVDPEQLKTADHHDIKLRNLPASYQLNTGDGASVLKSPAAVVKNQVVGGVNDLIGLTHLHEPAILHALRLRYDADIIYTATGPILIAVNPFKAMSLYSDDTMQAYRMQGEQGVGRVSPEKDSFVTPFKGRRGGASMRRSMSSLTRLPPHVYQTADDAYRAMMRGLENSVLMGQPKRGMQRGQNKAFGSQTNQSILVSGESGAGKTVTTKIVLDYLAMLSKIRDGGSHQGTTPTSPVRTPSMRFGETPSSATPGSEDVSIEQQVLKSNPILESFGNARTIRNDNSSRFGKYIDINFTKSGKLSGATIETYLLEKVRLIQPSMGERNYHVFYQFLSSATSTERQEFGIANSSYDDFRLLSESGTYDRRDGVSDVENHQEMLDAMITIGFAPDDVHELMRLVVAVLFAGNMTFTATNDGDCCVLDQNQASVNAAALLGVTMEGLSAALTEREINAGVEKVTKPLEILEARKAGEALIKAVYGAAFDFIVERVNAGIVDDTHSHGRGAASIGVLDIFGFETFQVNNFEQFCINYTNEALQQQFNKYVFKIEQQEYEREGILWKFISFPDNQDVLDLIDMKHTGVLSLLDEQCILPRSNDEKFTRYLYGRCDKHARFHASSSQRVDYKFSIEHYAGHVEYTTDSWLEKNKDQLPAAASALLKSSNFDLIGKIRKYVRAEDRAGRGSVATKSVGAQFSKQLKDLRAKIDTTVPHYIRCLKPNDDLVPDYFEPKNIVEQLRCGGVLEAVRVSRAGYPTRYPHDVFMARYYILGNRADRTPVSPPFSPDRFTQKESDLKRLISHIAYELWESDNSIGKEMSGNDAGGEHDHSGKQRNDPTSAAYMKSGVARAQERKTRKGEVITGNAAPYVPPYNLVVESSVKTPDDKQSKNKQFSFDGQGSADPDGTGAIVWPQNQSEFLSLDFPNRCAVAGLQLGRTKVFLRREAFDRIEALRSDKFFSAAAAIQKIVRGRICRIYFLVMRAAAVMIQSVIRMRIAGNRVVVVRYNTAARTIQRTFRGHQARKEVTELLMVRKFAATIIQRAFRASKYREMEHERGLEEERIIRGITRAQALFRGGKTRSFLLEEAAREEAEQAKLMSPEPQPPTPEPPTPEPPTPSPVQTLRAPPVERQLVPSQPPPTSRALTLNEDTKTELFRHIQEENWKTVEKILDANPELAEAPDSKSGELPLHMIARHSGAWTLLIDMVLVLYPKALIHRDKMGALPLHHAAAHDNHAALEIIYSAYKEGINDVDKKGRLPIHVAAEFDAVDSVKFLLSKSPEGAYTMVYRPPNNSGGGLPLHIACRNYASIGVITALLAENFASAKRTDENGDLPIHLLLRCGEVVDQVVVKTLLTCFSSAVSRTDMNGDLPLSLAIKHKCRSPVINTILMQFPDAAGVLNGDGHSPLFLAFKHSADDRTIMGLLNHAPELSTAVDRKTGLLPIQVATENEHSHFIVHNLLKRDMPIDLKEKVRAQLIPHHYSWNHIVSNTEDLYHSVVTKVLQSCTQPQVLALAHVEGPDSKIALQAASPVCKHEIRVMLRLFNTLEVVNQRPAYTNPVSDTQIFYALRYDPPKEQSGQFTIIHDDKKDGEDNDYLEDWDDSSQVSAMSRNSMRSTLTSRSQQTIEDKLRQIKREKGQQVIAKLTSRADVVERELKVRKDFHLSRHYVPAIISVHHTVQHAAYSEAMAEPGYCITMEGADTTAENLMLDMRKSGKPFPIKALKRIGISLLHMHEHGIIHGDFGTHNIGKFGSRWKLLGVGGSVAFGQPTDPNRGFYHPPESVVVENKRAAIGKKNVSACVVSVGAQTTYDIWAYGVVLYEAVARVPLGPYACRGKRAMSTNEVGKIGLWDELSVQKALRHIPEEDEAARDLVQQLLHFDPEERVQSMRNVLEHQFFGGSSLDGKKSRKSDGSGKVSSSHTGASSGSRPARSQDQQPQRQPQQQQQQQQQHRKRTTGSNPARAARSSNNRTARSSGSPASSNSSPAQENRVNGVAKNSNSNNKGNRGGLSETGSNTGQSPTSVDSRKSGRSFGGLGRFRNRRRNQAS